MRRKIVARKFPNARELLPPAISSPPSATAAHVNDRGLDAEAGTEVLEVAAVLPTPSDRKHRPPPVALLLSLLQVAAAGRAPSSQVAHAPAKTTRRPDPRSWSSGRSSSSSAGAADAGDGAADGARARAREAGLVLRAADSGDARRRGLQRRRPGGGGGPCLAGELSTVWRCSQDPIAFLDFWLRTFLSVFWTYLQFIFWALVYRALFNNIW